MNNIANYIQPTGPATPVVIHPDALAYLEKSGDQAHVETMHTTLQKMPLEHRPIVTDHVAFNPELTGEGEALPYPKSPPQKQPPIPPASGVSHILYGLSHWLGTTLMSDSDAWETIHASRLRKVKHLPPSQNS